jgi:hypothetical protein
MIRIKAGIGGGGVLVLDKFHPISGSEQRGRLAQAHPG